METDPKYFRIGIFSITLVTIAIVFMIVFSKLNIFSEKNLYTIYFSGSVNGLRENEDVKFHGVSVGKVMKIKISKNQTDKVKVIVDIHSPHLIRKNVTARIEAQGLTGFTFVQLYGGDKTYPLLTSDIPGKNPIIPSSPSNIESLITEAPKILDNINNLLIQIKKLFDDQTISNLKDTVANFKKVSETIEPKAQKVSLIIDDTHKTIQSISKIANSIESFIKLNRHPVENFTANSLPKVDLLIQDLQMTAQTLNRIASNVETNPISLLQKPLETGYDLP